MATTSRRPRLPGRRPRRRGPARRTRRPARTGLGLFPTRTRRDRRTRQRRTSPGNRLTVFAAVVTCLVLYIRANPWVGWVLLAVLVAAVAIAVLAFRVGRRRHRRLVQGVRTLQEFSEMTPGNFEHAVAELCRRDGCRNVRVVGGSGDLGADVLAVTPLGKLIVIQCKRYGVGTLVGSPEAQKVGGTARPVHGADEVAIVTTSGFTAEAQRYAAMPSVHIHLLGGQELIRWQADGWQPPWM
ncbi:restriction endonuclease [Streptomyces sp. H27-C3]|uniref:restriction endonuclease n=1 Tax=Streptomyces sp. H27-C3 TaxID=3046305 RepID=UPI0024B9F7C4|nr:restriction endonuclease [Streptomyces sp. H27-C3]MDJ0465024.1 restriction endonuclease [Streptomyces sp. H27-C3]